MISPCEACGKYRATIDDGAKNRCLSCHIVGGAVATTRVLDPRGRRQQAPAVASEVVAILESVRGALGLPEEVLLGSFETERGAFVTAADSEDPLAVLRGASRAQQRQAGPGAAAAAAAAEDPLAMLRGGSSSRARRQGTTANGKRPAAAAAGGGGGGGGDFTVRKRTRPVQMYDLGGSSADAGSAAVFAALQDEVPAHAAANGPGGVTVPYSDAPCPHCGGPAVVDLGVASEERDCRKVEVWGAGIDSQAGTTNVRCADLACGATWRVYDEVS